MGLSVGSECAAEREAGVGLDGPGGVFERSDELVEVGGVRDGGGGSGSRTQALDAAGN